MSEQTGHSVLRRLRERWKLQGILYCLLMAIAFTLPLTTVTYVWFAGHWWYGLPVFVLAMLATAWLFPYWRITIRDTVSWLDSHFPELEESSGLLLRSAEELGPLEKLQAGRTAARLAAIRNPRPLQARLLWAAGILAAACVVSMLLMTHAGGRQVIATKTISIPATPVAEKAAPDVASVNIRIIPPAYTGKPVREQQLFNIEAEEGSALIWQVRTNIAVDHPVFIFNDTLQVALTAESGDHRVWRLSRPAVHAGFYQVKTGDHLSALYKIEIRRDGPPQISIRKPKPYTIIDFGESKKLQLEAGISDDYGVVDAGIVATVASGSGEAVKFKEQVLRFDAGFTGGQKTYDLHKLLDLDAMGLHPGDELYFYCRARDNHGQETRSDMYIVSLPDTAQLMSLAGMTTGLDIKPELFRSERQIIIETEQLLREKDTITAQAFKDRSNNLGIDQKLLRLRYGKFLGEEAEEGGASEGYAAAGSSPADFGNVDKVRDAFTDKHDNAEDATFFDPVIKQQLKATLTEMWNAELRLRTFQTQEALPYEYKALRLLKDLQQKSRAFVAKTGVKTTPLDQGKRLTGKLDEIGLPQRHQAMTKDLSSEDQLRIALGLLESMKPGSDASGRNAGPSGAILSEALRRLGSLAAARPGEFLEGYQAMRRILDQGGRATDFDLAEAAIGKALPGAEARPLRRRQPADAGLSQYYFNHLNDPIQRP